METTTLKFTKGNAKLDKDTALFSLPAGHSCPGAKDCLSKIHKTTGKLTDGPDIKFRCYAVTSEYMFPHVRAARWHNFDMLKAWKTSGDMAQLICISLPQNIKRCRIHQSGDFFNQTYFDAWIEVAQLNPDIIFYAYTKALPFWISRINVIPANFKLTASRGGKFDSLIDTYSLKTCEVVFSEEEAKTKGLRIDHDDTLAWKQDKSFALLLHGMQPANSPSIKALMALRSENKGGYKSDYFAYNRKQTGQGLTLTKHSVN